MTPIDIVAWAIAIAVGIVFIGLAAYVVLALIWGLGMAKRNRG